MSKLHWCKNTDTIDIDNKSIGVHCFGIANRGLSIFIRHNGDPKLGKLADRIGKLIEKVLNNAEFIKDDQITKG